MARSDRCPTSSGAFRCDRPAGHDGECVTRETSKAWVGPAARSVTHVRSLQRTVINSHNLESPETPVIAGARLTQDALSSPAATHPAPDASTRQEGA